ncbi:MAG TPA: PD-(D/E)XK nuclease family protein, partial [Geobacteraceae bacterium]
NDFVEPEGAFFTPYLSAVFDREEGAARIPPPLPLALFSAPGGYRECEEIGRRIRELLARGVAPSAIAILFRTTEGYGAMMEDVCRRFRIPVSYRRGMPLFVSPLVRASLSPFVIVASRFGREELLELWKSTYVDLAGAGVSGDLLEETLLEAGYLDERQGRVEDVLHRHIAQLKRRGKNHEKAERVLEKVAPLMGELRGFGEEQTLREFVARLERFIARHRIYAQGISAADPRALKRDASAITLMQQVVRELEDDMGAVGLQDERLRPEAFAALLEQGMAGKFLAGERSEGVAVLNFHDARGLHFEHLFIGGLNEGICPALPAAHPFFKEGDKLLCNRAVGTKLFRTDGEKALEEPLLFHLALACAGSSLTLSFSYVDSRGNEMLRSPYLEELLDVVAVDETRLDIGQITPEPTRCYEREELLNALAAQGHLRPSPDLAPLLADSLERIAAGAAMEEERATFFATAEVATRSALSTPYTGTLRRRDILQLLTAFYETAPGDRFAPTVLEEYGACPFRYFLKRHLRLAPLDAPGMELAAKDAGSVVHEILRNVCQRLSQEGMVPLRNLAAARAILDEESRAVFAGWEGTRHTGATLLWETEQEKLLGLLSQWLEGEAGEEDALVPRAFELSFDGLEVEDSEGAKLYLQGKIDRVDLDVTAGVVRVVDYKMSGNSQKYSNLLRKEALGETSFQMPVYLLAAARQMGEDFAAPFDHFVARYWLLKKGGHRDKDFSAAGKEDYTGFFAVDTRERAGLAGDNFLNRLCAKVRGIKGGDFQITPQGCETCDFASVCRYVDVMTYEE